jgi:aromatic ring-opening dioxygenase LigB subunit
MKQIYQTKSTTLELLHNKVGDFGYELGISLYDRKLVLSFSEQELRGISNFISKFLEQEKDDS